MGVPEGVAKGEECAPARLVKVGAGGAAHHLEEVGYWVVLTACGAAAVIVLRAQDDHQRRSCCHAPAHRRRCDHHLRIHHTHLMRSPDPVVLVLKCCTWILRRLLRHEKSARACYLDIFSTGIPFTILHQLKCKCKCKCKDTVWLSCAGDDMQRNRPSPIAGLSCKVEVRVWLCMNNVAGKVAYLDGASVEQEVDNLLLGGRLRLVQERDAILQRVPQRPVAHLGQVRRQIFLAQLHVRTGAPQLEMTLSTNQNLPSQVTGEGNGKRYY